MPKYYKLYYLTQIGDVFLCLGYIHFGVDLMYLQ